MTTEELVEILKAAQEQNLLLVQGNGYEGIVKDLVISNITLENNTVVILVGRYPG